MATRSPEQRLRTMRLKELPAAIESERRTLETWDDSWNTPPLTPEYKEALEYQLRGHERELEELAAAEAQAAAAVAPEPESEVDADVDRARNAVEQLEADSAPAYGDLDQAADRLADEQYRLLTEYSQAREAGDTERAVATAAAYETAVHEGGRVYDAMAGFERDDPYLADPAADAYDVAEQHRLEEYQADLAEQGLTPARDDGYELVIE